MGAFGKARRRTSLGQRSRTCRPRLTDLRHLADGWVVRPVGVLWLVVAVPVVFWGA